MKEKRSIIDINRGAWPGRAICRRGTPTHEGNNMAREFRAQLDGRFRWAQLELEAGECARPEAG